MEYVIVWHIKKTRRIFLNNNYKNIYLCHGKNILSWSRVAPFDLIFIFEKMISHLLI